MVYSVLVLSDSHLLGSRDRELFGVNPYASLQKLSGHIRENHPPFDLVVVSGDLTDEGHSSAYNEIHNLIKDLGARTVWMMGNHDLIGHIPDELVRNYLFDDLSIQPWQIIFLDTTIAGKDEGSLRFEEQRRLIRFLDKSRNSHVLIFLHHQPVDVGSAFIDEIGLKNKQEFWNILNKYQHVRGILFGHVHQEFDLEIHGTRVMSTPSTWIQFKPMAREFEPDDPTSACRIIHLHMDGSIDTKIDRIDARF